MVARVVSVLRRVHGFAAIDEPLLRRFSALCEYAICERDTALEVGRVILLERGSLGVWAPAVQRGVRLVDVIVAPALIADVFAAPDVCRRSLRTRSACDLYFVGSAAVRALAGAEPALGLALLHNAVAREQTLIARLTSLLTLPLAARLRGFSAAEPPCTHDELAQLCGVSVRTVARAVKASRDRAACPPC